MKTIEIYKTENNEIAISVAMENDSVWLTQQQLSLLFTRDRSVISKHLSAIFRDEELDRKSVCAFFAHTGGDGKIYQVEHYNLDVIISIGYRVKSKEGTLFRQWATQRLKDLLMRGYSLNQQRLDELQQRISVIQKRFLESDSESFQAKGTIDLVSDYAKSFTLLSQFDNLTFREPNLKYDIHYEINESEALLEIAKLKVRLIEEGEASELFGNQKDRSFGGVLGSVLQSFDGHYLYATIEEQAANILYLIIKNHPFNDGNKRIAALMFVWFLQKNIHHLKNSGELKINDNALVVLALLIAQSNPAEKETMIQLIIQLIQTA